MKSIQLVLGVLASAIVSMSSCTLNENSEQSEVCVVDISIENEQYLIRPCEGYEYYEYIVDGDTIIAPYSLNYIYDHEVKTNVLIFGHAGEEKQKLVDTSFIAKKQV